VGFASTARVAGRFGLDTDDALEHLEDIRARGWVTSCHRLWFQRHEDLLVTLGVRRGEEPPG